MCTNVLLNYNPWQSLSVSQRVLMLLIAVSLMASSWTYICLNMIFTLHNYHIFFLFFFYVNIKEMTL